MRSLLCIARYLLLFMVMSAIGSSAKADPAIYQYVLRSTALIMHKDGQCWGSGALIDLENRLVVTNHHVVNGEIEVLVYFTAYDENGELITDRSVYNENYSALYECGIAMKGRIVGLWEKKDLALVQLDRLPAAAQALSLAAISAQPGERVHSVGNSCKSNALWTYTPGEVRNCYRNKHRLDTGERVDAFTLDTTSAINGGDSGGPMVNDNCELVGVVSSSVLKARLVSHAIDMREVAAFWAWYTERHPPVNDSASW